MSTQPRLETNGRQNKYTTKVQLDEPMSFIEIHYKNMNERLHTGVEKTQPRCITKGP